VLDLGSRHGAANLHLHLGGVAQEQGRSAEAETAYWQALDLRRETDPRAAAATAKQLGEVLAELGKHADATAVMLYAVATWRRITGEWGIDDLQFLIRERALLEPEEFAALIEAHMPADLRAELDTALPAVAKLPRPGEGMEPQDHSPEASSGRAQPEGSGS
jgi:tetratricopeptide (TPR) repeat protein